MGRVQLDGEEVDFQGPAPETIRAVWDLLEGHLAQSGYRIGELKVDGGPWKPGGNEDASGYGLIQVVSEEAPSDMLGLVETFLGESEGLRASWQQIAREALSTPWSEFQASAAQSVTGLQPLIEGGQLLSQHGEQLDAAWAQGLSSAVVELVASINKLIDALQGGDCIVFSDTAELELLPAMQRIFDVMRDVALAGLRKGDGSP